MISPQNINGANQDGNLHSDKAIENALNTMTTMHQVKNQKGMPPSGIKQPFGRQNRNILQRNKTKRVNIDRKLIASHDFGAQQNVNNINFGGGHSNQISIGGQNNLVATSSIAG